MPDTFARMRQITGTTVEWAANDLVIGYGEIAVELTGAGEARLKIGDGNRTFSALPYASSSATSVAWDNVTGRPTTFPPSTHNHPPSQVTGLVDSGGKLSLSLFPQSILEKMDWRGAHTPTLALEYPLAPVAGDTWGIAGPAYTFTTGPLVGRTVGEGSAIVYDNNTWWMVGGGPGVNPTDFVRVTDLVTTTSGPPEAGKVPQLNTSGRLDPSFINVPGQLFFRGTVDITQPPPVGVNSGDYWLVGVAGIAHAGWTGIAGQTLEVNDMVIWNGVVWTFTRSPGAASGFVPIDGSAPMTGPLSLVAGAPTAPAHATRRDYVLAQIAAIPSAVAQLGFTPLNPANNLSEVVDDAVARANLGLGTAATQNADAFLSSTNNLSDVPDDSVARANLGLGGAAVRSDSFFLQAAQNLNDIPDKGLARQNLGVPDLSDIILKSVVDAPGDLIVATAADTVTRLARGTPGQVLVSTASSIAWGSSLSLFSETILEANSLEISAPIPPDWKELTFQFMYRNVGLVSQRFIMQGALGPTNVNPATHNVQWTVSFGANVVGFGEGPLTAWVWSTFYTGWGQFKILKPLIGTTLVCSGEFYGIGGAGPSNYHVSASGYGMPAPPAIDRIRFLNFGGTPLLEAGSCVRVFAM